MCQEWLTLPVETLAERRLIDISTSMLLQHGLLRLDQERLDGPAAQLQRAEAAVE